MSHSRLEPWILQFVQSMLRPPNHQMDLICRYAQVLRVVPRTKELLVTDGVHALRLALTRSAISIHDKDYEDLCITTANLVGYRITFALESNLIVDVYSSPPSLIAVVTKLSSNLDRLHRPVGDVPLLETDPEIQAILAEHVRKYLVQFPRPFDPNSSNAETEDPQISHQQNMPLQIIGEDSVSVDAHGADDTHLPPLPPRNLLTNLEDFRATCKRDPGFGDVTKASIPLSGLPLPLSQVKGTNGEHQLSAITTPSTQRQDNDHLTGRYGLAPADENASPNQPPDPSREVHDSSDEHTASPLSMHDFQFEDDCDDDDVGQTENQNLPHSSNAISSLSPPRSGTADLGRDIRQRASPSPTGLALRPPSPAQSPPPLLPGQQMTSKLPLSESAGRHKRSESSSSSSADRESIQRKANSQQADPYLQSGPKSVFSPKSHAEPDTEFSVGKGTRRVLLSTVGETAELLQEATSERTGSCLKSVEVHLCNDVFNRAVNPNGDQVPCSATRKSNIASNTGALAVLQLPPLMDAENSGHEMESNSDSDLNIGCDAYQILGTQQMILSDPSEGLSDHQLTGGLDGEEEMSLSETPIANESVNDCRDMNLKQHTDDLMNMMHYHLERLDYLLRARRTDPWRACLAPRSVLNSSNGGYDGPQCKAEQFYFQEKVQSRAPSFGSSSAGYEEQKNHCVRSLPVSNIACGDQFSPDRRKRQCVRQTVGTAGGVNRTTVSIKLESELLGMNTEKYEKPRTRTQSDDNQVSRLAEG